MKMIFRQMYRKIIQILPTKLVLNVENFRGYHKIVNFKIPMYFGEKIQCLKLYGNLEKYSNYVDKYLVRDYIRETIGEEYLIPLIAQYKSPSEINYDVLPNKFVIKLNTGSGYNMIVHDKYNINKKKNEKILNKWLKEDYAKMKKEPQYKNIEKRILVEEYLEDDNSDLLDYKFFCFSGNVHFLKVDYDRHSQHKVNFYDKEFNKIDLKEGNYQNCKYDVEKPKNFEKMIEICEKLSKRFDFVRVDLYNIGGKIYFGELTFTPAAGINPFKPLYKDIEIAKLFEVPTKYNRKKVLYFGSMGFDSGRLDGVTMKSRCLNEYLLNQPLILRTIDVDNYKRRFLSIILDTLKFYNKADKIVLCSSSKGAYILLSFLDFIHCKKDVYYFVCGGSLNKSIENGLYKLNRYLKLKKIYVESQDMHNSMIKIGLSNVEKVPNFRKRIQFKDNYKKSKNVKFVFYGRIIKEKGIEYAIDLINRLNKNNYSCSLDIYGQISKEYFDILYNKFNSKVNYKGVIVPNGKNEYEILSQYDILLFPTEWSGEGLPGSLIDSYIAGLAIVASNWKYAKEYIDDGKNGVIFEYKNYDDMYIKALELLKSNKISAFKKHSKNLSEKYLIDNVLMDFSKDLLN